MPVVPASFSVWQPPQPAEANTCLPAAVGDAPPVEVVVVEVVDVDGEVVVVGVVVAAVTPQVGLPAHFATYSATSSASLPCTSFGGIGASG